MTLREHHLHHALATEDLFSIDFKLANALWFILKDLSRTIQLTANPLLNPFSDLQVPWTQNYSKISICLSPRSSLSKTILRTFWSWWVPGLNLNDFLVSRRGSDWQGLSGFRKLGSGLDRQEWVRLGLVSLWKLAYLFWTHTQNGLLQIRRRDCQFWRIWLRPFQGHNSSPYSF